MTKMHQNTFGGRAVELRELMHSPDPLAAMGAISRGKGEKGRGRGEAGKDLLLRGAKGRELRAERREGTEREGKGIPLKSR